MRTVENLLIAVCYAREISTGSNMSKNRINIQSPETFFAYGSSLRKVKYYEK